MHTHAFRNVHIYTAKLLLSDQWRDHQKAVAEEKGSPNATKVHHIKQSDNIFYTLTAHYFQQNPVFLISFESSYRDDSNETNNI